MFETFLKKAMSITERHLEHITTEFPFLNMSVTLSGRVFCGRHCATQSMDAIHHSRKSPMTRVLLLPLLERWGNWRFRRWTDWPKEKSCLCFCSVQLLSRVLLFETPWTTAHQAFLSFTVSWSWPKFMSIESVMLCNHLILCCPLLLLPSVFPSIRVFSSESALHIRWPKDWSFSIDSSNEYSKLISFRIDWFDLLAVQRTLKCFLQHQNSKA